MYCPYIIVIFKCQANDEEFRNIVVGEKKEVEAKESPELIKRFEELEYIFADLREDMAYSSLSCCNQGDELAAGVTYFNEKHREPCKKCVKEVNYYLSKIHKILEECDLYHDLSKSE